MKNQVEAILIGCTHFPYFLTEYQSRTRIPCINPDDALIEKSNQYFNKHWFDTDNNLGFFCFIF